MDASEELIIAAEHDFQAALEHPLFAGLIDASLPREVFRAFLEEDARFLVRQARNILRLASRLRELDAYAPLAGIGAGLPSALGMLYAPLLPRFGSSLEQAFAGSIHPCNEIYLRVSAGYLAEGTELEGLAFVLGFFLHHEVVGERARALHPDLPATDYGTWVNSWGANADFKLGVREIRSTFDRMALQATPEARDDARRAFLLCSRLEILFWDTFFPPATPRGTSFPNDLFAAR